jgi:creatinine amidohydrolase
MNDSISTRQIGALAFPEISRRLGEASILCLPIGAIEQHGPHLPLNTDVIIAEEITRRLLARWAEKFDLWQLPTISVGLSREHEWAPGTLSLSIASFTALMRDLGRSIQNLPTRNLAIINGHGGNRGVLQNLVYELEGDFGLNTCVIHPLALAGIDAGSAVPEIHAGRDETSLMLALVPHAVRTEMIELLTGVPDAKAVNELVIEQGATWAWRSDDARIADQGVTGQPLDSSAELGNAIIESIIREAGPVFARLIGRRRAGASRS